MDFTKIMLIAQWLLGKGDLLPRVIDLWDRAREASTLSEYVRLVGELCGILEGELADFPNLDVFMGAEDAAETDKAVRAEAASRGLDIATLITVAKLAYELWKLFKERKNQDQP